MMPLAVVQFHRGVSRLVRGKSSRIPRIQTRGMTQSREFRPLQAEEIARAFNAKSVE